jgi:hypothetical protein
MRIVLPAAAAVAITAFAIISFARGAEPAAISGFAFAETLTRTD